MMWNQIESEIHLHRHKTVIRACRGRPGANNKTQSSTNLPPKEEISEDDDSASVARKRRGIGQARLIKMRREKHEGLGISITVSNVTTSLMGEILVQKKLTEENKQIQFWFSAILFDCNLQNHILFYQKKFVLENGFTVYQFSWYFLTLLIKGGKEHGVPIIISEIHENMPAQRCGEVYVGDAILSVNGTDLKEATHKEAVHVLSRVHGDISMELVFVETDESNEEDNWEEDTDQRF